MSQLGQDVLKNQIDNYLLEINKCSAREQAERLYAIIGIKGNYEEIKSYKRPLYLDVKAFITQYLKAFETEDYGYDIPNNEKLLKAISTLPDKEQLAMCRFANKSYEDYGYDSAFLDVRMNKLKMQMACDEHRYLLYLLRWSGSNLKTLFASYSIFILVVFIVLLPAPFEWMGILKTIPQDFVTNPLINHLINTLAIVSGGDFAPEVAPNGLIGMLLIILGKIVFYLLIGNFIVKKITDFFSFE